MTLFSNNGIYSRYLVVMACRPTVAVQPQIQGVSQLLKQSDWAQIQDFKLYHNDDYIY